ncbi:MAG: transporter substrate-binding domain-containing protein [Alteromonadaceae bacterium]|nr:transporter substrate-binding domain-containing protein [Alteromonadaceae bacterium]
MRFAKLLLLCVCISFTAKAEMKLAAPFFPPYAYFDIDGNLSGIWIKQLEPLLQEAEIEFKAINTPIKRFYSSIATGKVELAALPKGMPGMENVLLSEKPFAHFDLRVFWLFDKPEISTLAHLAGQRVVLIKGYSYGGYLQQSLDEAQRGQFVVVENQLEAIKLLLADKADYVLGYWAMMDYLQKNFPDTQLNNHKVSEIPIFLAIHNRTPNANAIMQRFETAYGGMSK